MAGSLNRATIIGNCGKDPETRTMNSGDKVTNFSIATSESWTDKNSGEKKEKTQWHNIVVWRKLAEIAEKYIRKGSKVMVEGQIETRKWQDQSGVDKYTTEIVLRGFDAKLLLLGDKASHERGGSDDHSSGHGQSAQSQPRESFSADLDDDIPF